MSSPILSIVPFKQRLQKLDALMATPDFFQQPQKAARLAREHQHLSTLIEQYTQLQNLEATMAENSTLLKDPNLEPELHQLAQKEINTLKPTLAAKQRDVLLAMIPPDETDSRNTVMEIRAGTGGTEASLFASDLYRMYLRFAERRGWSVESLGSSLSEGNGLKLVSFLVKGENVYKYLKFEKGVHRVQRIPETEASGRIHTSTVTVAVLPEAKEVDLVIQPDELEISVCRASGPGGQGVNTTDSAVQILHQPTGMIVTCSDERSQLKNKLKAMTVLRSRLLEQKTQEEANQYAAERKSQVGSGARSERIRTYNFPQSRLTDHRIGLTLYSLPQIMEGALESVLEPLQKTDDDAKINALLNDPSLLTQ